MYRLDLSFEGKGFKSQTYKAFRTAEIIMMNLPVEARAILSEPFFENGKVEEHVIGMVQDGQVYFLESDPRPDQHGGYVRVK